MIKILIVEDEIPISKLIEMNLKDAGYTCTCAYDGMEAADYLEENTFDLVLLDIMLPKVNGYELFEYIKPLGIPVIFLTAMGHTNDIVKGLELGAEDYIIKPFEIVELLARVKVVLRRYNKAESILNILDIEIDTNNHNVEKDGKLIYLTHKEYELIVLFARNKNISLFRDKIYELAWNMEPDGDSRTLDVYVQRVRKKLGLEKYLKTIYRYGYRLEI